MPEPDGPMTQAGRPGGDVEVDAAQDPVGAEGEVDVAGGDTGGRLGRSRSVAASGTGVVPGAVAVTVPPG